MSWLWVVGAIWLGLGVLIGVLIGRGVALADRKQREVATAGEAPNFVVDPATPPTATLGIPEPSPPPAAENMSPPRKYGGL